MKQSDWSEILPGELSDVEVVLVSYRSRDHIAELLGSWPRGLRVAIVDNSSNCDGVRELAARSASVRYVDGGGQGFARGANLGARTATAEFLIFANPDSRPSVEQLIALIVGLRQDPSAAAHAGTPTGVDGTAEIGSGGWEPSVRRVLIYSLGLQSRWPRAGFFARPAGGEPIQVDWVCGACMAVRRRQFVALGGFDESFYLYAEDMSFGRRARLAGLWSVLRTDLPIPHTAGGSGAPPVEMLRLRGASFAGYVTRYHRPAAALLMRGILSLGAVARGGLQMLRGNVEQARGHLALAVGATTRRAYVGGREVAQARFVETADHGKQVSMADQ